MTEWHACGRCVYKDGKCYKCGRPEGEPKSWRPQYGIGPGMAALPEQRAENERRNDELRALVEPKPAHSPLGGSAAERYMECSASVALIRLLNEGVTEDADAPDEEWTAEGTLAHALGAHCLETSTDTYLYVGAEGKWEAVSPEMAVSVQVYLDYVRGSTGRFEVELALHCPDIHALMYGQIDCKKYGVSTDFLEIIDFKNGAGIVVPVVGNRQLQYYAAMVISKDRADYPDDMPVKLTIVQPNAWHTDGRVRSWMTTVGAILHWLHAELVPSMQRTQEFAGWYYSMGEHCRFCPAKLACPAFANLARRALDNAAGVTGAIDKPVMPEGWAPSITADDVVLLQMLITAYRKWAVSRLMSGGRPEDIGGKLVYGKADRVWKDGAEEELKLLWGPQAYAPAKLASPAQIEKLPGGEAFVAKHAYKPDGAPTLAPIGDERTTFIPNSASAIRGAHAQKALAMAGKT